MQSLYSYFTVKEDNMPVAERAMLKHINEVVELNLVIISLLIELVKHADNQHQPNGTMCALLTLVKHESVKSNSNMTLKMRQCSLLCEITEII